MSDLTRSRADSSVSEVTRSRTALVQSQLGAAGALLVRVSALYKTGALSEFDRRDIKDRIVDGEPDDIIDRVLREFEVRGPFCVFRFPVNLCSRTSSKTIGKCRRRTSTHGTNSLIVQDRPPAKAPVLAVPEAHVRPEQRTGCHRSN